jgi:hypothetical protein
VEEAMRPTLRLAVAAERVALVTVAAAVAAAAKGTAV